MKMIFRLESEEAVANAFKNKLSRFTADDIHAFALHLFNNQTKELNKYDIADKMSIDPHQVAPMIARLRSCGFIVASIGKRAEVKYQMQGIQDIVKGKIKNFVAPKLNPLIESVFC